MEPKTGIGLWRDYSHEWINVIMEVGSKLQEWVPCKWIC